MCVYFLVHERCTTGTRKARCFLRKLRHTENAIRAPCKFAFKPKHSIRFHFACCFLLLLFVDARGTIYALGALVYLMGKKIGSKQKERKTNAVLFIGWMDTCSHVEHDTFIRFFFFLIFNSKLKNWSNRMKLIYREDHFVFASLFELCAVAFIYISIRRYVGVHANGIKHLSVYLFYLKRFVILFIRSPRFDCYFFTGINIEQARQAVRAWATPSKNIECTYKHTNNKYMCHLILTSYLLLISEKLIDAKAIFVPVELHFIFVENHWQKKCCIVCSKRHTHTHSNPKKTQFSMYSFVWATYALMCAKRNACKWANRSGSMLHEYTY